MKRRNLLGHTAIGVTALTVATSSRLSAQTASPSAAGQSTIRWRMATSYPTSLDIMFSTIETLCQQVSAMTDGQFVITPYAAGEISPALKVLDAVSDGIAECGYTIGLYYADRIPALGFMGGVPFGLNAQQQNAWLYYGGGLESIQKIYRGLNIINFPAGSVGGQMGGWFRREINSVDDLKGLKIRLSGLGGTLLKRMGADIQLLAPTEIAQALLEGRIEAVEFLGPYGDEKLGLNKAAPYYYYPSWWEPGATNELLINSKQWNALPQNYQEILQIAAAEAHVKLHARYAVANSAALNRLVAGGTKLKAFKPEFVKVLYEAAFEMYEEMSGQDTQFRDVYQQWKAFRSKVYQWNRINELGFANFAFNAEA